MGSSMSKINDDYDDYIYFCKVLGVDTVGFRESFYDHESKLLENLGFKNKYDYYAMLDKTKKRETIINNILNEGIS